MTRRKRYVILLALGLVAGIALWNFPRDREPSYQGRTLTQWLQIRALAVEAADGAQRDSATLAIQAIGTNGLPTLVKALNYNKPRVVKSVEGFIAPIAARFGMLRKYSRFTQRREVLAWQATDAFGILGTNAAPAVPALMGLATKKAQSAYPAMMALNSIGPPGRAGLVSILKAPANPHRAVIPFLLSSSKSAMEIIVPALVDCLNDPDPNVRITASGALKNLAPELLTNTVPSH